MRSIQAAAMILFLTVIAGANGQGIHFLSPDELSSDARGGKSACTSSTSGKNCAHSATCDGQTAPNCSGTCAAGTNTVNSTTQCATAKPWDVKNCQAQVLDPDGCGKQLVNATCTAQNGVCACIGQAGNDDSPQNSVVYDENCRTVP